MKKALIEILVCPSCLPEERRLTEHVIREQEDDILAGSLTCRHCGQRFPIRDGVAFLTLADPRSAKADSKYETPSALSSYLWSHYSDLLKEPEASAAYREWVNLMHLKGGLAIDIGTAVGRFAFEMTLRSDFVIGIDNSVSFIQAARALMMKRRGKILLPLAGRISRKATVTLSDEWDVKKVEFIVADAHALPFKANTFSSLASLNIIDKVAVPLKHLQETNRVARDKDAQLLFFRSLIIL